MRVVVVHATIVNFFSINPFFCFVKFETENFPPPYGMFCPAHQKVVVAYVLCGMYCLVCSV